MFVKINVGKSIFFLILKLQFNFFPITKINSSYDKKVIFIKI